MQGTGSGCSRCDWCAHEAGSCGHTHEVLWGRCTGQSEDPPSTVNTLIKIMRVSRVCDPECAVQLAAKAVLAQSRMCT